MDGRQSFPQMVLGQLDFHRQNIQKYTDLSLTLCKNSFMDLNVEMSINKTFKETLAKNPWDLWL